MKKSWREILIFALSMSLVYLLAQKQERRAYEAVIADNAQMKTFLSNTITQVSTKGDENLKAVFRQLGYNIPQTQVKK